jgi:hypothetical protein
VQGASCRRRGEIEGALGAMCGELDAWKQTLQSRIRPNMLWTNIGLRCIVGCCGCIVLDGG